MKVLRNEKSKKVDVLFHAHDKKILSLLCNNVRLPLSKIAQLTNLSRQSVEYRIKSMEKANLLAGSRTVINIRKLGYKSFHYFITLLNKEAEQELIARCQKHPSVNALLSYSGKWNYEISIMEKSEIDAEKKFQEILTSLSAIKSKCIILETITAKVLPRHLQQIQERIKNIRSDPSFSKEFNLPKLEHIPDKKDKKIMYLLAQDAKINLSKIAKEVGLTDDAISYRIKKLIRSDHILQFRPVIDFSVLNLNLNALLIKAKNRTNAKENKLKKFLKENESVLWATEIFGENNFLIYMLTENNEEIHNFIEKLKEIYEESLESYEILLGKEEYKYSFMPSSLIEE